MCRESMMRWTASADLLARTVCCPNLVCPRLGDALLEQTRGAKGGEATSQEPGSAFPTARTWPGAKGGTGSPDNRIKGSCSPQISNFKLKHPHLKAFGKSAPCEKCTTLVQRELRQSTASSNSGSSHHLILTATSTG